MKKCYLTHTVPDITLHSPTVTEIPETRTEHFTQTDATILCIYTTEKALIRTIGDIFPPLIYCTGVITLTHSEVTITIAVAIAAEALSTMTAQHTSHSGNFPQKTIIPTKEDSQLPIQSLLTTHGKELNLSHMREHTNGVLPI